MRSATPIPKPQWRKLPIFFLLALNIAAVVINVLWQSRAVSCDRKSEVDINIRKEHFSPKNHMREEPLQVNKKHKKKRKPIPLTELAGSHQEKRCQPGPGFALVEDTVLDPSLAYAGGRKIPRVVHMTAKSRCMLREFAENIDKWRFPDYSVFVHDNAAMDRLLHRDWPEFVQLEKAMECVKGCSPGALKADIWRLLIMWEYGGIYTDFDNAPNKFNGTTLMINDDGFFVVERVGTPSQWFFAAAPRHPIIYYTMQQALLNIYTMIEDVGKIEPVRTTGPEALNDGFNRFVGRDIGKNASGFYVGDGFRTARIVGVQENQNEYVIRGFVGLDEKARLYEKMNMTHLFSYYATNQATFESCLQHLRRIDTPQDWEPTLW